jgi:hypothetical protein
MIIKSGQKLWTKQDFIINDDSAEIGNYEHRMGDTGTVILIKSASYRYPVAVLFDVKEEYYSYAEIEKYFYDKARWRDKQINSILDGD